MYDEIHVYSVVSWFALLVSSKQVQKYQLSRHNDVVTLLSSINNLSVGLDNRNSIIFTQCLGVLTGIGLDKFAESLTFLRSDWQVNNLFVCTQISQRSSARKQARIYTENTSD